MPGLARRRDRFLAAPRGLLRVAEDGERPRHEAEARKPRMEGILGSEAEAGRKADGERLIQMPATFDDLAAQHQGAADSATARHLEGRVGPTFADSPELPREPARPIELGTGAVERPEAVEDRS